MERFWEPWCIFTATKRGKDKMRKTAKKKSLLGGNQKILSICLAVIVVSTALIGWKVSRQKTNIPSEQSLDTAVGTYRTFLPAADSPGRIITLQLFASHDVSFTQDYRNDEEPFRAQGTWQRGTENSLQVDLTAGGEYAMTFSSDEGNPPTLKLQADSQGSWGENGLTLQKIDPLLANKWVWEKTEYSNDTQSQPQETGVFSLQFEENGQLFISTDCNNGRTNYEITGSSAVSFSPIASTKKFCQDSQETAFFQALSQGVSYQYQEGKLFLSLKTDSGIMVFAPQPRE